MSAHDECYMIAIFEWPSRRFLELYETPFPVEDDFQVFGKEIGDFHRFRSPRRFQSGFQWLYED
jgi:hypothetical protein